MKAENQLTGKKHPRDENDEQEDQKDEDNTNDNSLSTMPSTSISCILCLEFSSDTKIIQPHQCQQCKANSWHICNQCETSLFSKLCPICRGDYAPIKYYPFLVSPDDLQQQQQQDNSTILSQNAINLAKISLIQYEKIGIWCPNSTPPVIHFSFPQDLSVEPRDMKFLHVTLPITENEELNRLSNLSTAEPVFLFTSSIWDRLDEILQGTESRDISLISADGPSTHNVNNNNNNNNENSNDRITHQSNDQVNTSSSQDPTTTPTTTPPDEPTPQIEEAKGQNEDVEGGVTREGEGNINVDGEAGEGEGEGEEEGEDGDLLEEDNHLLGIKETLQKIIALLSEEGAIFLTPLNSLEVLDLVEAYLTSQG